MRVESLAKLVGRRATVAAPEGLHHALEPEQLEGVRLARAAQAHDGPALVWFEIHETQNVFPMMPAGKGLSDLIEKWGGADE